MSPSTTRSERRRKTRRKPLSLVYVELASGNGGMMRDLSEEGFAVRAMMPLRAGEETPFAFALADKAPIEGQGHIQWIAENGHVAGVRFTEISGAARKQIRDWLSRPEKTSTREQPPAKPEPKEATLEQLREEMHSVPPRPQGTHPPLEAPPEPTAAEPTPPAEAAVHKEAEPVASAPVTGVPEPVVPVEVAPSPAAPEPSQAEPAHEAPRPPEAHVPAPVILPESPAVSETAAVPAAPVPAAEVVHEVLPHAQETHRVAAEPTPPISKVPEPVAPVVAHPEPPPEPVHAVHAEEQRRLFEEDAAPPLPRLTLTPKIVDSESHPSFTSAFPSVPHAPDAGHVWRPIEPSQEPRDEAGREEAKPGAPDISAILMQPPGKSRQEAPRVEPAGSHSSWELASPRERSRVRPSATGAVAAMAILALLVALFVFHRNIGQGLIWLGEALGGVPETRGRQASPSNTAGPASGEGSAGQTNSPTAQQPPETSSSPTMTPFPGASPPAGADADAGQTEYAEAMQLLKGTNAAADTREGLRLLWIAVEKGNANAEMELAEMYRSGRGVVHNCDQARILLTAAARKGSAEAQKRLLEFQRAGCE